MEGTKTITLSDLLWACVYQVLHWMHYHKQKCCFPIKDMTKLLPVTRRVQVATFVSKGNEFQSGT